MTTRERTLEAMVRPGTMFDSKHRVVRELGRGGMGAVVEAENIGLGSKVALKIMLPSLAHDAALVERFLREARATARVSSEHVARVLDVASLPEGTPYLVMELLQGENMGAYIDRRAVTDAEAYLLLLQVCEGLAHAHAAGLVHRDLKPENVFIVRRRSGEPCAKILDFGIAKDVALATAMTATSDAFGSPSYMSPEQIKSSRSVDARSDVWALGVVAFELFSRTLPFPGQTVFEVGARVLGEAPLALASLRPDLPAPVVAAIMACLEKARERRTPDVARFAEAIAPFVPGGPGMVEGIRTVLGASQLPRPSHAAVESVSNLGAPPQAVAVDNDTQLTVSRRPEHPLGGKRGAAIAVASLGLAIGALAIAVRARVHPSADTHPLAATTMGATAPLPSTQVSLSATPAAAAPVESAAVPSVGSARPAPSGTTAPKASAEPRPSVASSRPAASASANAATSAAPKHYDRHGE